MSQPDLSDKIAILIFARPVATDAAHKRLTNHASSMRCVLERLNKNVGQVAAATGLPVLRSTDLITHQGTFGNQFSAALQVAFDQGFERVIVVGNDCPALTTTHLLQAANALQSTSVVLGPDRRGGLYLFGLSREAFDKDLLEQLPWQTHTLSSSTRRVFAGQSVVLLARLGDVNHLADLRLYRDSALIVNALVNELLALIAQRDRSLFSVFCGRAWVVDWLSNGSLRAPPANR